MSDDEHDVTLLVKFRVYGNSTAKDTATALAAYTDTFMTASGEETEVIAAGDADEFFVRSYANRVDVSRHDDGTYPATRVSFPVGVSVTFAQVVQAFEHPELPPPWMDRPDPATLEWQIYVEDFYAEQDRAREQVRDGTDTRAMSRLVTEAARLLVQGKERGGPPCCGTLSSFHFPWCVTGMRLHRNPA